MTMKALPLDMRPYIFATTPTANALCLWWWLCVENVRGEGEAYPTAAVTSLWPWNLVPTKWFVTQPIHEIATRTA